MTKKRSHPGALFYGFVLPSSGYRIFCMPNDPIKEFLEGLSDDDVLPPSLEDIDRAVEQPLDASDEMQRYLANEPKLAATVRRIRKLLEKG